MHNNLPYARPSNHFFKERQKAVLSKSRLIHLHYNAERMWVVPQPNTVDTSQFSVEATPCRQNIAQCVHFGKCALDVAYAETENLVR